MDEKKMALIFKAFCDENRIRILKMLRSGEKCACKMLDELNVTQPTLSHHMKILCDSGIVLGRKEGKWMYYFGRRGESRCGLYKGVNIRPKGITSRDVKSRKSNLFRTTSFNTYI